MYVCAILFSVCGFQVAFASEADFLALYKSHLSQVVECKDYACYKNLLKKEGSLTTRKNLEKISEKDGVYYFGINKKTAQDRITRVMNISKKEIAKDKARLVIKYQDVPSMESEISFPKRAKCGK